MSAKSRPQYRSTTYSTRDITNGVESGFTNPINYAWVDTTAGGENPDWRKDIRRARSATTVFSGSKRKLVFSPGLYSIHYWAGGTVQEDRYRSRLGNICNANWPSTSGISETGANNEALMRLIKKAREAQTTFQGSVFLGELAETLRMIRNPAKTLRKGFDKYLSDAKKRTKALKNRKKSPSNRKKLDIVQDTWLEHSFGWTPLINDIESGAKALAQRRHEFRRTTEEVRAFARKETSSSVHGGSYGIAWLNYKWRNLDVNRADVIYLGAVKREVVNDRAVSSQIFGFRPNTWLPTVWELIPYSFLVDYFTNIGELVSAWSYHKSNFAWLNKTVRKVAERRVQDCALDWRYAKNNVESNAGWRWIGYEEFHPTFEMTVSTVNRAPYTGSLIPDLEFQIPGMRSTKWANIAALGTGHRSALRSIFSRR